MQWSDEGIVLTARRHGESAFLLSVLTVDHGRHAGLVRTHTDLNPTQLRNDYYYCYYFYFVYGQHYSLY